MEQPSGHELNADQIAYWNGPGGQRWADRDAAQEVLLRPIAEVLLERAGPRPGERVLDIGCGAGATTVMFAKAVAPGGFVLGLDVSGPMLARAREAAPKNLPLDFVLADATVYPFDPASFDLLASRFGVMFFADPVLSFANLRRALKPSGRLTFVCWREPRDNPWMMAPLQAVYQHVPKMPPVGPEEAVQATNDVTGSVPATVQEPVMLPRARTGMTTAAPKRVQKPRRKVTRRARAAAAYCSRSSIATGRPRRALRLPPAIIGSIVMTASGPLMVISSPAAPSSLPSRRLPRRRARSSIGPDGGTPTAQ